MTPTFDKKTIEKMLLDKNYNFTDSPFEPSSDKPIDQEKLTFDKLAEYLENTYQTSEDSDYHLNTIKKIIGSLRAQNLLKQNNSEKFKVLTHFSILSKGKKGWVNLITSGSTRTSKPSLSNNPSGFAKKISKN